VTEVKIRRRKERNIRTDIQRTTGNTHEPKLNLRLRGFAAPLPLQADVTMELSHQKTGTTTHGVVTGRKATNSGLPGMAFLNFLVGEAWGIMLQIPYEYYQNERKGTETNTSDPSLAETERLRLLALKTLQTVQPTSDETSIWPQTWNSGRRNLRSNGLRIH
jgi:hypothetical protein